MRGEYAMDKEKGTKWQTREATVEDDRKRWLMKNEDKRNEKIRAPCASLEVRRKSRKTENERVMCEEVGMYWLKKGEGKDEWK